MATQSQYVQQAGPGFVSPIQAVLLSRSLFWGVLLMCPTLKDEKPDHRTPTERIIGCYTKGNMTFVLMQLMAAALILNSTASYPIGFKRESVCLPWESGIYLLRQQDQDDTSRDHAGVYEATLANVNPFFEACTARMDVWAGPKASQQRASLHHPRSRWLVPPACFILKI
ncbi:hypothetical protein BJY01DRAFT_254958 [Aspergillus pseudoustus]|uniref:Uncharacterized protein n=1 Tax=Aspergillus pseudoustus TaxID=1810923 RepID=A0ABR4IPT6_9EURO